MFGGFRSIVPALGVIVALHAATPAAAHGVKAKYRFLPEGQIRVEAWYDVTEDPVKNAKIAVFDNGTKIIEGQTDDDGAFIFSYTGVANLRVTIDAGAGHRANLLIPAAALTNRHEGDSSSATPNSHMGYKDVVLGVALVLALAAFWLSWRNARKISAMQSRSG